MCFSGRTRNVESSYVGRQGDSESDRYTFGEEKKINNEVLMELPRQLSGSRLAPLESVYFGSNEGRGPSHRYSHD
jgi:hypothetical protein